MGFLDELSRVTGPFVDKVNDTLNYHGFLLHSRLERIEAGIGTLGRPDVGDLWAKVPINKKFPAGESELFSADLNEIIPIQFITINGLALKTPAFKIVAGGAMVLAFAKEGVGQETIGGDIVILPGERVSIIMAEEGTVEATLGITRVQIAKHNKAMQYGLSEELLAANNTHDPNRDVIMSPNGEWAPEPPETIDSGGRPPIVR